eukprot:1720946-Amphidinium_carterae.1
MECFTRDYQPWCGFRTSYNDILQEVDSETEVASRQCIVVETPTPPLVEVEEQSGGEEHQQLHA